MTKKIFPKVVGVARKLIDCPNSTKKHFTFLVKRNKILAFGFNNGWDSDPLANKYGHRFAGIHSELAAIKSFPYSPVFLRECSLINVRLKLDGSIALSKPCKQCQILLHDFDVGEVWYSTNNGEFLCLK